MKWFDDLLIWLGLKAEPIEVKPVEYPPVPIPTKKEALVTDVKPPLDLKANKKSPVTRKTSSRKAPVKPGK